jgi:hypothetical protein
LRTPALLALGAAALFAGALGVYGTGESEAVVAEPVAVAALPPDIPQNITVARVVTLVEGPIPARPPRLDRFSFMPSDHVAMLVLPPVDDLPPLRGTIDREVAAPWSTETRPETAPPAEASRVSAWTSPPSDPTAPRLLPQSRPPIRDRALARRLAQIAPGASKRIRERFAAAKIAWPPNEIGLVAIKDEKTVDMYGRDDAGKWKLIHRYRVFAASGGAGPKLRQGDRQVPEGIYAISYLNPHSRYHVSLRVNYPNDFDRKMAAADGRRDLGGDIMIHGKASSIGCLAVGDEAAEEIFWLAAEIGQRNMRLIIAPSDFRRRGIPAIEAGAPQWLPKLYTEVAAAMTEYPTPPPQKTTPIGLLSFFGN